MMHLAVVLEQFCGKLGLRVPKDLSIVFFNNSLFSRITNPQLTTVGGHFAFYCSCRCKSIQRAVVWGTSRKSITGSALFAKSSV